MVERGNWDIIHSFFRDNENFLVRHHLDSYNDFILTKIPQTLRQYNPFIIYKDKLQGETYKHTINIYFGGREGNKIYLSQPVIYDKITGEKKHMYPNEARLKNLDYASHLFCDVEIEYQTYDTDAITKVFHKVELGRIPIMLKSKHCILYSQPSETLVQMGECPYDQGGYFIIGGMEKVIVSHERKVENKIYIIKSNNDKYLYGAQIKSVPEEGFKYARTTSVYISSEDQSIDVIVSRIDHPVPVFIVFRALGIITDKDILEYILYDLDTDLSKYMLQTLRVSVEKAQVISSQELALSYLAKIINGRSISYVVRLLLESVFPHVGNNYIRKAYYLGLVVRRLIMVNAGLLEPTDRDSYIYKRVDLSGFLLANLFRDNFKQLLRNCKIQIDTLYRFNASYENDIASIVTEENRNIIFSINKMEEPMFKSFKLGDLLGKKGLIQALSRVSNLSTIAHLRRVNTPNDLVMINQRRLHNTQYGIFDCVDSPDGSNIGIKKHLSAMAYITVGCSFKPIIDLLRENNLTFLDEMIPRDIIRNTKVFVNGNWIGIHSDPQKLIDQIQLLRRNAMINVYTSISWNRFLKEINIETDGGRICKPFYVMKENKILLTDEIVDHVKKGYYRWNHLFSGFGKRKVPFDHYDCKYYCPEEVFSGKADLEKNQGIIEYLDVEELSSSLVSFTISDLPEDSLEKYTHSEIHPYLMYGASGFCIPFSNCNQLPRNVFSCGHSRQSVGVYATNYRNRFDTFAYVNYYPQKPLVHTRLSHMVFEDKMPAGMNAIVAIACYSGYNQEDSVIINKSALDRGLFRTAYFRSYSDIELQETGKNVSEEFYNPLRINEDVDLKKGYNYDKLDNRGVVRENEYVTDKDIIIGKYAVNGKEVVDLSMSTNRGHSGRVEKVYYTNYNSDDHKICKVRISNERVPTFGDKFASRHGQKGTVGIVFRQEDMPFSKDGIVPDIIINPHAIPSRMTIGQLLECLMGKMCCITGSIGDATPFENYDVVKHISDILETHCKFERYGNEILYNGRDGKQIKTAIFIGPTYYQRLKLMTKDKINVRATGSVTLKERQPPSGKAIGGGLRIGEMERDSILSHGIAQFLKESMLERSDKYSIHVDNKSGRQAVVNPRRNIYMSPSCDGPIQFKGESIENLKVNVINKNCMNFSRVEIPYCFKLLMQECESMGMVMHAVTDRAVIEDRGYFNDEILGPRPMKKRDVPKKPTRRVSTDEIDRLLKAISDDEEEGEEPEPEITGEHKYIRYPRIKEGNMIHRNDLVDLIEKIIADNNNSSIEDINVEFNIKKINEEEYQFVGEEGEMLTQYTILADIGHQLDSFVDGTVTTFVISSSYHVTGLGLDESPTFHPGEDVSVSPTFHPGKDLGLEEVDISGDPKPKPKSVSPSSSESASSEWSDVTSPPTATSFSESSVSSSESKPSSPNPKGGSSNSQDIKVITFTPRAMTPDVEGECQFQQDDDIDVNVQDQHQEPELTLRPEYLLNRKKLVLAKKGKYKDGDLEIVEL